MMVPKMRIKKAKAPQLKEKNEKCRVLQQWSANGSIWYELEYILPRGLRKGAEHRENYVKNRKTNNSSNQH